MPGHGVRFVFVSHRLLVRWALACLWFMAWAASAQALDARPIPAAGLDISPSVAALEDPGGALVPRQMPTPGVAERFAAGLGKAGAFNFDITPSAWWFRFTLDNSGDDALTRVLDVGYARLSHVALYQLADDGTVRSVETGVTAPFASRPIAWRQFAFPLHLGAHSQQTFYLRVQSLTAFIVPLRLWEPAAFERHMAADAAAQAWYFGMAAAMVPFNLLIFIWLRERIFLFYVFFVSSMAFALAGQNGLVKQFMPFEPPWWSDLASTFGYSFAIATGLQFMRSLLDTRQTLARWDAALRAMVWFFLLSPAVFPFTGQTLIKPAAVVYLLAILVAAAVIAQGVVRHQRSAYFYGVAALALAAGALGNVLRAMGLVATNVVTANAMQIGSALEMVLLALALADRYGQMRREKIAMQRELLEAQTRLIEHLQRSEQQLEQKVQERTRELSRVNRQLSALSMTDGLTGIANRRHFDAALQAEWQRARRSGEPISLALLDVDWFKSYNDHLGHQAGDECLRRITQIMARSVQRHTDVVARYGGEEFVVLAPGVASAGLMQVCEHIREELRRLALPHPGSAFGTVSVSMGIACASPVEGGSGQELLRRADDALYRAKEQGRDRICVAERGGGLQAMP